jgi:GH25 family lysozyme M1 (1,4-beta-N-acetylmuramidase)
MLLLPDTSEFQTGTTAPNWPAIKNQNGGACAIRVGYGNAHLDSMFVSNKTEIQNAGFGFALLYHYLRADQDALSQAQAFCNWVGSGQLKSWMRPALDLEEGSGNQISRANAWFNYVDDFFGLTGPLQSRSWLYTGDSFATSSGLSAICNSSRHTWIAKYSSTAPANAFTLWQCTNGSVGSHITSWSGSGKIDTSVYSGSLALLAETIKAPTNGTAEEMVPSVAYWSTNTYYARLSGSQVQYRGPETGGKWLAVQTATPAVGGATIAISSAGEKTIAYTDGDGHTCRLIAAPGTDTWAFDDMDD